MTGLFPSHRGRASSCPSYDRSDSVTLQHLMHDYKMIKLWTGIENALAIMSIIIASQ